MEKKAQTALEYLVTYGWALVILVTILAILYFLIGNPPSGITFQSTDPLTILPKSSNISGPNVNVNLLNASGKKIKITGVRYKGGFYGGSLNGINAASINSSNPIYSITGTELLFSASNPSGSFDNITITFEEDGFTKTVEIIPNQIDNSKLKCNTSCTAGVCNGAGCYPTDPNCTEWGNLVSACCGNSICQTGECTTGCTSDCTAAQCRGNGTCDTAYNECLTYPADCTVAQCQGNGQCDKDPKYNECKNYPGDCTAAECQGNSQCDSAFNECTTYPADCSAAACCGSGVCESTYGENCQNCPTDCGLCPKGHTCGVSTECQTGFCTDGICCESACSGYCQYCNKTGSLGTCITRNASDNVECPSCQTCNGIAVNCTNQTTAWNAGLYNCAGSNKRCYTGNCYTCSGYLYNYSGTDTTKACWYAASGAGISCNTACSSHQGCDSSGGWNDSADNWCPVCHTLIGASYTCNGGSYGPLFHTLVNSCYDRGFGSADCSYSNPYNRLLCVCNT